MKKGSSEFQRSKSPIFSQKSMQNLTKDNPELKSYVDSELQKGHEDQLVSLGED